MPFMPSHNFCHPDLALIILLDNQLGAHLVGEKTEAKLSKKGRTGLRLYPTIPETSHVIMIKYHCDQNLQKYLAAQANAVLVLNLQGSAGDEGAPGGIGGVCKVWVNRDQFSIYVNMIFIFFVSTRCLGSQPITAISQRTWQMIVPPFQIPRCSCSDGCPGPYTDGQDQCTVEGIQVHRQCTVGRSALRWAAEHCTGLAHNLHLRLHNLSTEGPCTRNCTCRHCSGVHSRAPLGDEDLDGINKNKPKMITL